MSKKSASPAPRLRSSEDKLYQSCLQACIEGIENLPVDKRQVSSTPTTTPLLNPAVTTNDTPVERAVTPPHQLEPASLLLSPPVTPQRESSVTRIHSPASDGTMNRTPLHGAPVRGQVVPPRDPPHPMLSTYGNQDARGVASSFGNQDARGNLAVQPAANAGTFKFKKNAVKIVSAPTPSSPFCAPSAPSPAPGPVKATPREVDRTELVQPTAKHESPVAAMSPTVPKVSRPVSAIKEESALEDLFARLSAQTSPSASVVSTKIRAPATPRSELFLFGTPQSANATTSTPMIEIELVKETVKNGKKTTAKMDQAEIEQLYLRQAAAYLQALPDVEDVAVQTLKAVTIKLRKLYSLNTKLSVDDIEKLKARYAFAILHYINKTGKNDHKTVTLDFIKKVLLDNNGNMLALYAKLVEAKCLSLGDMDGLVAMCKLILNILPKADPSAPAAPAEIEPAVTAKIEARQLSQDPIDYAEAWPSQEKRENPAAHRTCILKGVSSVKSINELQALVWGGRLESISLPVPGADWAVVKFLTSEGCDEYFKATENGIEIHGDKKALVFVEKQPGPSSINDVIKNCIEGDVSRCVRALDAEEDWSDVMLMKFARGKGTLKREVDRIKHGKTARGRHYIDFRFATIYNALNFKRQLHHDLDWEHCTISYAPDPCETARSVHYKDDGEEATGFFA